MTVPSSLASSDDSPAADAYTRAGVNLGARNEFVEQLKRITGGNNARVLSGVGGFGALYRLMGYRDPVLAASVDGVGTKIRIAEIMGRFDTVGQDLVNHCVNDILTTGAEPLFFLDYLGSSDLPADVKVQVIEGLNRACDAHDCKLIGGETADMPDVYAAGDFDLVGFIVGAVERESIIDGAKNIREGDALLGLPVTGLHTNGYSLVRRIFNIGVGGDPAAGRATLDTWYEDLNSTLGDALLAVHKSYYGDLKPVLPSLRGFAHITGGGLIDNVPRILPDGLAARFDASWDVPAIFSLIQRRGDISDADMYHTFNMGIGAVLAVDNAEADALAAQIPGARRVGRIIRQSGERRVIIE